MSIRLYVGNLPKDEVERDNLHAVFAEHGGDSISTKVIKDRKTGKCRGYAFVTVPTDEIADVLIEKFNGETFMDSPLKVEKALPRAKAKPSEEGDVGSSSSNPPVKASGNGNRRRNGKSGNKVAASSGGSDSFQPDPRWADKLSQLKEMLAAQN
ncbi:MAG: RNA-binding protein [Cyanobacteria bacterium P01_H01_bin.15]